METLKLRYHIERWNWLGLSTTLAFIVSKDNIANTS